VPDWLNRKWVPPTTILLARVLVSPCLGIGDCSPVALDVTRVLD
jgi:hypothetical protein